MDDHNLERRLLGHLDGLAPEQIWRASNAALDALGEALDPRSARQIAELLPERLRAPLLRGKGPQELSTDDVFRHVSRKLGVSEGRAVELTEMVLEGLAAVLEPEVLKRFKHVLGAPLDGLLEARPAVASPPAVPKTSQPSGAPDHTLAGGRTGSSRPLSEARPDALAHRHSVASNPAPHSDTKISSASGQTQEREDETLASGKP